MVGREGRRWRQEPGKGRSNDERRQRSCECIGLGVFGVGMWEFVCRCLVGKGLAAGGEQELLCAGGSCELHGI